MRGDESEVTLSLTLSVFFAALAADIVWVRWMLRVTQLRPESAALWAALIILVGSVGINAIAITIWYALPAAVGSAIGTWGTTKWEKERVSGT